MADLPPPDAQVTLSTTLDAPIDRGWQALRSPATLAYVWKGWLGFHPVDPPDLPAFWVPGDYLVRLTAWGFVPLGRQVLGIEFPAIDPPRCAIRDNGRGSLVRRWDHWIILDPQGDRTRYTDRVRVEAGWLTPIILPWARGFHAHRQRRWRRLIAQGFDPSP